MKRGPTIALLVLLPACTKNNLLYTPTTGLDLSSSSVNDLSASDLAGEDLAMVLPDLAGGGVDLARVRDLGNVDLSQVQCGDLAGCCGALNQPCCFLGSCNTGLFCSGGTTCTNCGQPGKACCPGSTCGGGACCNGSVCVPDGKPCGVDKICLNSICVGCGQSAGQACCSANRCTTGLCCNPIANTCAASNSNECTCGAVAAACCSTGNLPGTSVPKAAACTVGAAVCDNDGSNPPSCQPCGGDGQPCCAGNTCFLDGGCCALGVCRANGTACQGLTGNCVAGSCSNGSCGGVNQACCSNTCTAADTRCLPLANQTDTACQPCGGKDERCCFDPGSSPSAPVPVFCEPPFAPTIEPQFNICFCR